MANAGGSEFRNVTFPRYTGYGVKTMPGAREAIELKQWKDADAEIVRIATALDREAELVNRAADVLERQ